MSFDRNLGRFPCRCEASMEFFSRVDGSQKMFSISVAFGEQNMAGHRFTSHHTNSHSSGLRTVPRGLRGDASEALAHERPGGERHPLAAQ